MPFFLIEQFFCLSFQPNTVISIASLSPQLRTPRLRVIARCPTSTFTLYGTVNWWPESGQTRSLCVLRCNMWPNEQFQAFFLACHTIKRKYAKSICVQLTFFTDFKPENHTLSSWSVIKPRQQLKYTLLELKI
jgi:hypothetical protein